MQPNLLLNIFVLLNFGGGTTTLQVDINTTYETAAKLLDDDEEFKAIESQERERLYAEFVEELKKKREELLGVLLLVAGKVWREAPDALLEIVRGDR